MHIRSIRLRDWKAYVDAALEFPKPTKRRNVVLLGAMNGYGKTSLLEALVLCLFGRDGLGILARSVMRDGETDRLAQSYDDFLERAVHARAIEQGRTSASVEVSLRDEDETITIQRIWHFSGSGKHRREDEEVRIWNGPDRDLVRIPKLEDRDDFLRSFVAQTFLPVHLAQFFLFDGEQVQRLAKRDMSAQVRAGIEGMLGVPVLRELSRDLNAYAQNRRGSVKKVGDETIERLRAEVQEIEARVQAAQEELDHLEPAIEPLRAKRDQIVKDLGSLHGGNYANLRELLENKGRVERERDRERERLAALLRADLALAICGSDLRKRLAERLDAEEERAKWEHGKSQSGDGLSRLLHAFETSPIQVDPPLTETQSSTIRERVRTAWESVWHPPPVRCADGYRHPYLGSSDRALVLGRLEQVEEIALGNIRDILDQLDQYDRDLRKLESQVASQYGISDKVEAATWAFG